MIYISIGSNIGNRLSYLQKAVKLLKERYFKDLKSSIILETQAILPDTAPSEWNKPFLNMVVCGSCSLSPEELLTGLKQIECEIGRPQGYEKWSPRIIDLDIVIWGNLVLDTPRLTIPHPELMNRPFLLHLIAMLNPMSILPINGKTFGAIAGDIEVCFIKSFALSPEFVGIVNITPDSFSDGGLYHDENKAIEHALQLLSDGASIIELGAQSTRPGSSIQTPQTEYARLKPVLDHLHQHMEIKISIDSFWPEVILNVLERYNITWINDVKGDLNDDTLKAIAQSGCSIVIMHSLSIPPSKHNIISDSVNPIDTVHCWAEENINRLLALGFDQSSIIIDPGIGFGKSSYQSILLLRNIEALKRLGCKVLVGHSRKSYISSFATGLPCDRDLETIASSSILHNKVDFLRVHNVRDHMKFFVTQVALYGNG
ncbi:dihydropteroate synthase [Wolbachia endosymbiont of Pentalonia nigronervosa]|uniref:dihydropteroate synthase n=1 Tax=Wolbachia endosymbiont of Pentalonia nigronervosa TaxID=1301914 RepID=UPI00165FED9C|nr:dihydropteroate synthase [Wolbachia endosymbiont of Pentalonia nigronervosa]MBD0391948.1 dihydropteroate synthase [Wolbachia endosymbiont of Pentalonia nigronervosa]